MLMQALTLLLGILAKDGEQVGLGDAHIGL